MYRFLFLFCFWSFSSAFLQTVGAIQKRCALQDGFFWWEAPDSSRVFCYANKFYNQAITTDITREFEDIAPDGDTIFIPFGVGDHGGGPTRKDIETAQLLNNTPRFPKMRLSTFESMYNSFGRDKAELPVRRGEMQYTFVGCYTSVARAKEGNRRSESALYSGEVMSSLNRFLGGVYPANSQTSRAGEKMRYSIRMRAIYAIFVGTEKCVRDGEF